MSELRFPLTDDWLYLSQQQAESDSRGWAAMAAEQLFAQRGEQADAAAKSAVAEHLDGVARLYLRVGGLGCLLLVPGGAPPVRAMVRIESVAGPATEHEYRAQSEALLPPAEWLVHPADVSTVESAAGPVLRVHVRTADPARTPGPVRDTFYWSWWFADVPETVLASVAFATVAESAYLADDTELMLLGMERLDGPGARAVAPSGGVYD